MHVWVYCQDISHFYSHIYNIFISYCFENFYLITKLIELSEGSFWSQQKQYFV